MRASQTNPAKTVAQVLPRHRLAIFVILLIAFFLRTYQLGDQSLRGDEAATVLYSALSITDLWELSRITDPHPPFYYLLLHPWQAMVGEEAWVMRFAGVVASLLSVATLYALARRTLKAYTISLLATTLLALNAFQIWLAQDIRSYPFFTLLGLFSSGTLWLALKQPKTRLTPWLLYVLLTVASLYVHYYTVFLIAFQGLFVLFNLKKFWDKKWLWLISQIVIALAISPGLRLAYNFIGQAAGGIETIPTTATFQRASTALLTGFTIDGTWGLGLSLLLAPVWLIGLMTLWRWDVTTGSFWTLFFIVPVAGVIALSIDRPFFKERFLIQAQPAFELLLAVGFLRLAGVRQASTQPRATSQSPTSRLRVVAAILLALLLYANTLALSNYFIDPAYAKSPPWHLYRDYVSREARPGDVMLTNFPEAAVSYYSPNDLPFYVTPAERDRPVEFRLQETEQIASAYERIWFLPLQRQGFDEEGAVLDWLDRHADRVNQVFFPAYHLNLYRSPPAIEAMLIEQPVTFVHGVHLRGFQIFDKAGDSRLEPFNGEWLLTLEPEEEFNLSLYWLAEGPTEEPYTVFTHLIAADSFNRASQDNQPVWGTYPTSAWQPGDRITDKYSLTIPAGTPPGDHRLRLGWYHSETQERVPVLDGAGQPGADHVLLDLILRVE